MAGEQYAQEGQKVQLKDGTVAVVKNGQLVAVPGGARASGGGARKMSPQAQIFLNKLSSDAQSAAEVGRLYDRVEGTIKRLKPGPYRNSLLLSPAIPEDEGGVLDKIGAVAVGIPARLSGAVTPQETSDYQTMRAVQNAAVLERQLPQKGAQTESDAARMMLADVSPGKDTEANMEVIRAGRRKIERDQAKAIFFTKWAQKYGHGGLDPQGHSADELWARAADYIVARTIHGVGPGGKPPPARRPGTGIRVISRTGVTK